MKKKQSQIVTIYVLKHTETGLYYAGEGRWRDGPSGRVWEPRPTAESEEGGEELDQEDINDIFIDRPLSGWEKIKLYDLEPRG